MGYLSEEQRRLMGIAPRPLGAWSAELAEATLKMSWAAGVNLINTSLGDLRHTGVTWLEKVAGGEWKAGKVANLKSKGGKKHRGRLRFTAQGGPPRSLVVDLLQEEAPGEYDQDGNYVTDLIRIEASYRIYTGGKSAVSSATIGLGQLKQVKELDKSLLPAIKAQVEKHLKVSEEDPAKVRDAAVKKLAKEGLAWLRKTTGVTEGWTVEEASSIEPWTHFALKVGGLMPVMTVGVAIEPLDPGEGFQVAGVLLGGHGTPIEDYGPLVASAEDLEDVVSLTLKPLEPGIKTFLGADKKKAETVLKEVMALYKGMRLGLVRARKVVELVGGALEAKSYDGVGPKCWELEKELQGVIESSQQLRDKLP